MNSQFMAFLSVKLEFDDTIAIGDSQRQLRNFRRKYIVSEENA